MPSPDPGELLGTPAMSVCVLQSQKQQLPRGLSSPNLDLPKNSLLEPQNVQVLIIGDLVSSLRTYQF